MASDGESDLSEVPTVASNPFTIARSVASSVNPAQHTRFRENRRPIANPQNRPISRNPTQTPTQNPPLNTPAESPVRQAASLGNSEGAGDEEEDSGIHLQTPGPGSSVSQSSDASRNPKNRPKTSFIHEHAHSRMKADGAYWQCKTCGKAYKTSGGTGAMAKHLNDKHRVDPEANPIAKRRDENGTAVDAAIHRHADAIHEFSTQEEARRREELIGLSLNKTTLEYLYLRWIVTQDIAFNQVTHEPFRDFLEYINPTANRLLPNASSTIRRHALGLFNEGKQRLRHLLAVAISNIHITCDMWTSPNNLGVIAIVAHFTSEKLQLETMTLALKELEGEHSGLNQARVVLGVINDFRIRNKLGYFVMDNASLNGTLIDAIANSLRADDIAYDSDQRRLRCNGHVINLVV